MKTPRSFQVELLTIAWKGEINNPQIWWKNRLFWKKTLIVLNLPPQENCQSYIWFCWIWTPNTTKLLDMTC